jgi:vitamin B12 transporter
MEKNKMNRTMLKTLLIVLMLLLFATAAVNADDTDKTQTMDEMVVTSTRTEKRAVDVPVSSEVITRDKIESSGATHLGDLIGKYMTGHYHKYSGILSSPGMRGFMTEAHGDDTKGHILILIDGHRIGTGNAAKISLDRIERVEVTKGPASALYGSAAMGGVINMITKKGDGDLTATFGGEYGSFDYYKGQLSGGGEVNDKFRFFATASYEDADDYDTPEYGTVYNSWVTKKNIGGNFVYAINPNHDLRLGGNYAYNTHGSPAWTNKAYSTYYEEAENSQFNNKSNAYGDLEYNGDFLDGKVHWRGTFYYIWDRNHYNYGYAGYGSTNPRDYQSKYTDETLGTDHQFAWKMASWNELLLGFNLEYLEKEGSGVSAGQVSQPYTPNMDYDTQALFIQDSLNLFHNRVNIILAGRYDHYDVSTLRPTEVEVTDFNERSEDFSHFSPKAGIGVKFFDELLRLRANVGEGFKAPSADQMSADYVHSATGEHYVGNPDLDPETNMTYDVGIDIFHDFFTLKTSFFHTDYSDKIVKESAVIDGEEVTTYDNHGDATMEGFEINLEWHVGYTFNLPFDMSLWSNTAINTTKDDEETEEDLQFISDYEVKSGIDLKYQGFSAQVSYVLVGPQMITNYDEYPNTIEEKDAFDFWDITLSYEFLNHWKVKASVLNVFDDTVEWIRGYPMEERNYRVGLSYSF